MKDLYQFPKKTDLLEIDLDSYINLNQKFTQTFTTFHETLNCFEKEVNEKFSIKNFEWFSLKTLELLPFTSGHRKILQLIKTRYHYENLSH